MPTEESRVVWQAGSLDELKRALRERELGAAMGLVEAFLRHLENQSGRASLDDCSGVLAVLRKHTRFAEMVRVGEALHEHGYGDPEISRQLAQGRIEMGEITVAIRDLKALRTRLERATDPKAAENLGETIGLLGRAYKQLYVDAAPNPAERREHDWREAKTHYEHAWTNGLGDHRWNGINLVALLNHREMIEQGDPRVRSNEAREPAQRILDEIADEARRSPLGPWDLATRAEALLALDDYPGAKQAIRQYLEHDDTDAFMVRGTLRQLRQLWMLDEDRAPGDEIVPVMTAKLAWLGGQVDVELTGKHVKLYERVWGDTRYEPVDWMRTALKRARVVARIGRNAYNGVGTGFLFDGALINEQLAQRHLLLTNAHVCTPSADLRKVTPFPLDPNDVVAAFFEVVGDDGQPFVQKPVECLWSSPPWELDATLLELPKRPPDVELPPLSQAIGQLAVKDRLNIVGHPNGGPMSISLQDNRLSDALGDRYLRYRTPTDPGSSGSPVFDQQWNLVGLHHAAAPEANEGIRMDVLLDAMRKALP